MRLTHSYTATFKGVWFNVKRQRNLKHSLENEKSRVKLYKSGKHWIKSGIKEIKLMRIIGLPIFSNHTMEDSDEGKEKGNFVKEML